MEIMLVRNFLMKNGRKCKLVKKVSVISPEYKNDKVPYITLAIDNI